MISEDYYLLKHITNIYLLINNILTIVNWQRFTDSVTTVNEYINYININCCQPNSCSKRFQDLELNVLENHFQYVNIKYEGVIAIVYFMGPHAR